MPSKGSMNAPPISSVRTTRAQNAIGDGMSSYAGLRIKGMDPASEYSSYKKDIRTWHPDKSDRASAASYGLSL